MPSSRPARSSPAPGSDTWSTRVRRGCTGRACSTTPRAFALPTSATSRSNAAAARILGGVGHVGSWYLAIEVVIGVFGLAVATTLARRGDWLAAAAVTGTTGPAGVPDLLDSPLGLDTAGADRHASRRRCQPARGRVRLPAVRARPDVVHAARESQQPVRLSLADDGDRELFHARRTWLPGIHGSLCLAAARPATSLEL